MLPLWIVFDVRLAKDGVNSGISRFIVGLTKALVKELHKINSGQARKTKLLLVSKFEPAAWIVDLVLQYPESVSFWSGGKGALSSWWDKPVYCWPTSSHAWIKSIVNDDAIWVYPGNFDRPISYLIGKKYLQHTVQIVHDTIPFEQKKSIGILFGMQYRVRIRRALNKLPLIITVSDHSAKMLGNLSTSASASIKVIGEGIDSAFGKYHKPQDASEREFLRKQFLNLSGFLAVKNIDENYLQRCKWVIGIGRHQAYKCWDTAERSLAMCKGKAGENIIFIRVSSDSASIEYYRSKGGVWCGQNMWVAELSTLLIPNLADESLALLYRISDLLIHPSLAEGFGLPPLEAALSGLPVIFRQGTAIDGHFADNILPRFFWCPTMGRNDGEWASALMHMLENTEASQKFYKKMAQFVSPREFIVKLSENSFEWALSAQKFLQAIDRI